MVCLLSLVFFYLLILTKVYRVLARRAVLSGELSIKFDYVILFTLICRAPPNMTRLLYRWGLGPVLKEKSRKCERIHYVNGTSYFPLHTTHLTMSLGNSGGLLGVIVLNEEVLQDLNSDMILLRVNK
jgi:hypothetical protein